jgi:signal transduction histidine kinase
MDLHPAVAAGAALLTCLALAPPLVGSPAASAPHGVWEVDFGDPAEEDRWFEIPWPSRPCQVTWSIDELRGSDGDGRPVLSLTATSGLGVESLGIIARRFDSTFAPSPNSVVVLEWEWHLSDTDVSDWAALGVLWCEPDGTPVPTVGPVLYSHSRYTKSWRTFFDPERRWIHHRVVTPPLDHHIGAGDGRRPCGIFLNVLDPVRQTVRVSRLRVEEWPPGALDVDPIFLPQRAPPSREPYVPRPLARLSHATAGALEDLDGDGLPELLALGWREWPHLYLNDGSGGFRTEITRDRGLDFSTLPTGAIFLDLDGDRDRDLVVSAERDLPRLFEAHAGLRWEERASVEHGHLSFWYGCAADDLDGDGLVDLACVTPVAGPSFLTLRNEGGMTFRRAKWFDQRQLSPASSLNYATTAADLDGDDRPDLLLAREHLLHNEGGWFERVAQPWPHNGTEVAEGGIFADFDGDHTLDLLMVRDAIMTALPSRLYPGRGDGRFDAPRAEFAWESSEVVLAEDFDNDADLDLYVCQQRRPNHLLLNDGRGRFVQATEGSGLAEQSECNAAVAADVNGDGGMDVVVFRYGAPPAVLVNRVARGRWLGVIVEGQPPRTDAIGTRITVIDPESGAPLASRWVRRGRGFGCTGPRELRIGLGNRVRVDVVARFPGGHERRLVGVKADQTILLREPSPRLAGRVANSVAEEVFPLVRAYRRAVARQPWAAGGFALAGLLLVLPLVGPGRRPVSTAALLVGLGGMMAAAALLGAAPGRGLSGRPLGLVLLGALAGAILSRAVARSRAAPRRARQTPAPVVSSEDLVRCSHDFRHAGAETRTLQALHSRLENLFFRGPVHAPFLDELRAIARCYPGSSSPRLRQLLRLARAALPDRTLIEQTAAVEAAVQARLARLRPLDGDDRALRAWRDDLAPRVAELRQLVETVLAHIDRHNSTDVRAAIDEVLRLSATRLTSAGIKVRVVEQAEAPVFALMARPDMLLVLENLVANAVHTMSDTPERRLTITLALTQRKVRVEVADTGRGVPAHIRARLFEYGFTTRADGRGYGLARSREIVGHYGGSLRLVEAGPGEGATFLLMLRRIEATVAFPAVSPAGQMSDRFAG